MNAPQAAPTDSPLSPTPQAAGWAYGRQPHVAPPAGGYPAAWRSLEASLWRWVRLHGGSQPLAWAAAWASWAEAQGHSALDLGHSALPELAGYPSLQQALQAENPAWLMQVDAAPAHSAASPFVLQAGHFYLRRNFRHEDQVAQLLRQRLQAPTAPQCPMSAADLQALFGPPDAAGHDSAQRHAVQTAPTQKLLVLTGGPGTGKTTTVLRMLLAISRELAAQQGGTLPRIGVAAPTGKAAQRLGESLRQGAQALQTLQSAQDATLWPQWQPHVQAVLAQAPATVHRLLGAGPSGLRHHAGAPLPLDVLVVDEASMLDLALLQSLLLALPPHARLLLVGDADQLSSVGTGSVLMDLVQALERSASPALLRLQHCFRAHDQLQPILQAVRAGEASAMQQAWQAAGPAVAQMPGLSGVADLPPLLQQWQRSLAGHLLQAGVAQSLPADDSAALSLALAALGQQQLLCAQREGPFGAEACSATIEAALRPQLLAQGAAQEGEWFAGRCIMVAQNHASMGLFNGDVGLCLSVRLPDGSSALRVAFAPTPEQAAQGLGLRLLPPHSLPAHNLAYAITIHKSQGSEYRSVAVLLPPGGQSPLLTRQTLYTALSRAKQKVQLWSDDASLQQAIAQRLQRHGLLAWRLGAGLN